MANGAKADRLAAEQESADVENEEYKRAEAIKQATRDLWREWGSRYQPCTLFTYNATCLDQNVVVAELRLYIRGLRDYITSGMGIVLTGPPGTGKDHLLASLAHCALGLGFTIKWTSGLRLFERVREDIHEDRGESATVRAHVGPDILILSDPAWQKQPLTAHQQAKLGRIVDDRSNRKKPIWVSINASGADEAERLLGGPLVDRLKDGALSLACNWPSHRRSIETLSRG